MVGSLRGVWYKRWGESVYLRSRNDSMFVYKWKRNSGEKKVRIPKEISLSR